ncbi:hypothetical protein AC579_6135 [Pseudocercospora musae]|uniref:Uncharacterized protein n=1 Tax=Pseudocercospora musae TaxID=113226 RepID=A0A139ILW4_9PEZI|nr:hypothetical protein AC579_6135 [Pseudocercospora musae]
MAQPAAHEISPTGPTSNSTRPSASKPASRIATPPARASPGESAGTSFRAINHRALPQNAQIESAAATGNPSGSSSDLTPPRSEAVVVAQDAPQTAQTSTSASQPAKSSAPADNLDGAMAESTYGTRSRNRTNARPNYAEDQDMDFEFSSAATTTTKKKTNDAPAASASSASCKINQSICPDHSNGSGPGTKESTPGPSSAAATSKKRKAAGAAATSLHSQAASATPPPAAASRKSAAPSTSSSLARETNVMTFSKHRHRLNKNGELIADDGTKLSVNDHVYLVCEPPGDPYYVCRVMEFLHADSDDPNSPVDSLRVNWYYRPRDVQRFSSDTRLVYGTMHSDLCPLTSLRGKCTIKHRSEIEDLDAYRKERDCFYFVQVFDRFIRRSYECIPVSQIVNVPEKVKKALDERWKFVVVEIGRVKELTSAAKSCKRCARYCASSDSVDCAICKNSYHMNCVQPPLPKKPSRGFAWACGPCSRASEKKQDARNTPASGHATEAEEEEPVEEEELPAASSVTTRAPSPSGDDMVIDEHPATQAEIALAKMWPMRYLGIHARVEDALQYDDRAIYPRASSRLGPRHQANVNMWHGRPVELVKPAEIKKRYQKGGAQKKEGKLTKESLAAIEADKEDKAKRPKWVQDEPPGYIARGEDYDANDPRCTATLLFKMPGPDDEITVDPSTVMDMSWQHEKDPETRNDMLVKSYTAKAQTHARAVGVPPFGTNFLDKIIEHLTKSRYNVDVALRRVSKLDRERDLHEPLLSRSDLVKFEEGVAKYGSEHRLIRLHMKTTLPHSHIVRFYYLWKKTPKGREIWGNYGGRKKRKVESDAGAKLQAELANDGDDSAFDSNKAARKGRGFQCKFCNTTHSRQWRRAPGVAPGQVAAPEKGVKSDKKDRPLLALCLRCAGLWRKYAIQWEEIDEVAKKVVAGGAKALKRKIDEELMRELIAANEAANNPPEPPMPSIPTVENGEPPKKKSKTDKNGTLAAAETAKKVEKPPPPPKEPTPPPPPIIPAQPTWKVLPCAVCKGVDDTIACAHCKLTVHRRCFGVDKNEGVRSNGEVYWVCDQCQNDRNPSVSTDYSCCLCLTEETLVDLVEPPKVSHKKKTDREKEKERLEKELADGMRAEYRSKQLSHHRPVVPREPLKRTAGNCWVHINCAVWAPETRFSNAEALEVVEGIQSIPASRFEAVCKLCKNKDHHNKLRENSGACVNCFSCQASFHVSCAFEAGYTFGFDVTPVKGSRKDQVITATLGQETGAVTPVILCKEHPIGAKTVLHPIDEMNEETGKNALQTYVTAYKQADLTLTGTVRKAHQAQITKDKGQQPASSLASNRRESGAHSIAAAVRRGARTSSVAETKVEADDSANDTSNVPGANGRKCMKCNVDVTPRWHPVFREAKEEGAKSPEQPRMSITLGEITDANRSAAGSETLHRPSEPPRQHIRFMAPGANGRAWDGMPDRFAPSRPVNGDTRPHEGSPSVPAGAPAADPAAPAQLSGDSRGGIGDPIRVDQNDDVFHGHGLPQFRNPAANLEPSQTEAETKEEPPSEWLCHKCFVKRKTDPTPPPEDRADRPALSPPKQFPLQLEFNRGSQPPAPTPSIEEQFLVWDRPVRPTPAPPPPPPPPVNGMPGSGFHPPPPPHHMGHPPPTHPYAPPFAQQPNGYHGGPPPHPMHERHGSHGNSYGYPPPQHSPGPPAPYYGPPGGPRPPHLNGYHTPVQSSPHNPHQPPLQSPTYQHPPQHPQMGGPRPDGQYPPQLHPLGPPVHSSPHAPFGRPGSQPASAAPQHPPLPGPPNPMNPQQQSMPQQSASQPAQTQQQQASAPIPPSIGQQPPGQPPGQQPAASSPQPGNARRTGSEQPRPTTPRDSQANGFAGASASPNLMNLIH